MQAKTRSRSPRSSSQQLAASNVSAYDAAGVIIVQPPMSQISGVKRPLSHTNSFTGDSLPMHGVETPNESQLGELLVNIDSWGIDIFRIGDLSQTRPLTCVAYTIFQVYIYSTHFSENGFGSRINRWFSELV